MKYKYNVHIKDNVINKNKRNGAGYRCQVVLLWISSWLQWKLKTLTFSLQLLSMETIDKQTDCTDNAGDQSSVNIDKQMWPLLYTCGCTGMLFPIKVTLKQKRRTHKQHHIRNCFPLPTSGESKGYLLLNLNCNWNCSPSYSVPDTPSM